MNYSKIHVQYRDGSKPKGIKVVLGFSGLLGGMTKPAYTDSQGTALVEHASKGRADVYVSGKKCGSLSAPGETAVFI
ncbi:MAG: hypothetical protein IT427_15835 [Pirellulales bacterium]|nr:hypothetical protein [Pirellulales bacterium]